jgi:translation elongation factor EF-Ts
MCFFTLRMLQMGREIGIVQLKASNGSSASQEVLTELQNIGRRLCMHVVAAKPLYLSSKEVPPLVMQAESAIYRCVYAMCLK